MPDRIAERKILNINDLQDSYRNNMPGIDLNVQFTFYYDETINPRTFHLRSGTLNYSTDSNFVLGGLFHQGAKPDLEPLFKSLKFQSSLKDVKFKHVAQGNLPECLKSERLHEYLRYLKESSINVHFSTINLFYFSIVDIVDSVIAVLPEAAGAGMDFIFLLKHDLYKVCKIEQDSIINLFARHNYPNLNTSQVNSFIKDLIIILNRHQEHPDLMIGVRILTQLLKQCMTSAALPFVMNNEDLVLIKNFSGSYIDPLCQYPASKHIFDEEAFIAGIVDQYEFRFNDRLLKHYTFMKSEDELMIQASDIWVGFVGRIFTFFNTHTHAEIQELQHYLNSFQRQNLALYFDIIDQADSKSRYLLKYFISTEDSGKMGLLYESCR